MLAIVAYFCLVVAPGCAIAFAIRPSIYRRPILLLATAPAFAYALSFASTAVLDSFGAGPWPGLLIANGVAVVAGAVRFGIHAHGSGRDQTGGDKAGGNQAGGNDARDHLSDEIRLAHLLLGAAILLGALMWLAPGKPSVPMNGDVQNHAHFITRIIEEDSVDPSVVIAENPIGSSPAASFYPLAAHSTIAVAQMATTQSIPDLLITWPMLSAILSFPCGIFVLARRLMPGRELVAGLASLVASVGAEFPYFPMYWGGVPFLIAMSLVPGVVALALDAVDSREWSLYTLAAIATAGTVFAHTSEIAVLAVILSCLAIHDILNARKAVPLENANSLRRVVGSWGVFAGACALLLAPTLAAMLGATSENSGYEIVADNGFAAAVSTLLGGSTQPIIGLLGLAGIAIVIVNRRSSPPGRMRGALWALGVFALLLLSTLLGGAVWDLLRSVTVPWYKSWWRLTYNLAILFPLFAAVALDTTRMAVARSGRYHTRTYLIGISVLAVVVLAPSAWKTLGRTGVHGQSLEASELALFDDLKVMVDRDRGNGSSGESGRYEVVLNQSTDQTAWMYPIAGVRPFSGMHSFDDTPDRTDREYLLKHVSEAAENSRVQALLERWNIHYLLLGETSYPDEFVAMDLDQIRDADGFKLVEQRGRFWLFEIPRPKQPV